MELTIDQALQHGVAAHKEGKLEEAEKLYRSILATQPQHADANHNLGVLAVGVGKVQESLPLFKAALETNSNQGQYWLSYIDAFIRLGQLDNARSVLEQGRSIGLNGDQVDQLEEQLIKGPNIPSEMTVDHLVGLYNQGRFEDALKLGLALGEESSDNPEVPNILGAIYAGLGQYEDAIIYYNKAINLKPDYAEIHYNLGNTFSKLEKYEDAVVSYNNAINYKPKYTDAHYNLGNALLETGYYKKAIKQFRRAIDFEPGFAEAYDNLGSALSNLGQYQEAIIFHKKAIEISPGYSKAYNNIGVISNNLKDHSVAIEHYKMAIVLQPQDMTIWNNISVTLNEIGRYEEALAHLKKAILTDQYGAQAWFSNGVALKGLERYEQAVESFKKAVELKPDYATAYNNVGVNLHKLKDYVAAFENFRKAITLQPEDVTAWNNMSITLNEIERHDDAIVNLKKAICIDPWDSAALFNTGSALYNLGETSNGAIGSPTFGTLEAALKHYKKAIILEPSHAISITGVGSILNDFGDYTEAVRYLSFANTIDNNEIITQALRLSSFQACNKIKKANEIKCRIMASFTKTVKADTHRPITALIVKGRVGSMFLHSLFDGHPEISTIPGPYLKGWFGKGAWDQLAPDTSKNNWRTLFTQKILFEYQPLFDAGSRKNVIGKPLKSTWLAHSLGFTNLGEKQEISFHLDKEKFASAFLSLLDQKKTLTQQQGFEIFHDAFEIAYRNRQVSQKKYPNNIFYHFHNPNNYELCHFLSLYPNSRLLSIVRNPIQNLESWMLMDLGDGPYGWASAVSRVNEILKSFQSPFNIHSKAVRLEDIKHKPTESMLSLASWLDIVDDPALYISSFCDFKYWGPQSKNTEVITGFDAQSVKLPLGRLFGKNDLIVFETLFWPFSKKYSYTVISETEFRANLKAIRRLIDKPLQFEEVLYNALPEKHGPIEEQIPYKMLHGTLKHYWQVLDKDGNYPGIATPLWET